MERGSYRKNIKIDTLVRMLKKEGLSESEILAKYNVREIIEIRITRLVRNKQIIYNEGKYYPRKSGLLLFVKFTEVMHRLVPGEKREA